MQKTLLVFVVAACVGTSYAQGRCTERCIDLAQLYNNINYSSEDIRRLAYSFTGCNVECLNSQDEEQSTTTGPIATEAEETPPPEEEEENKTASRKRNSAPLGHVGRDHGARHGVVRHSKHAKHGKHGIHGSPHNS